MIDPAGNIIQVESVKGDYEALFTAAGAIAGEVQLKNVDKKRIDLINTLQKLHFWNTVNQFKMEMYI